MDTRLLTCRSPTQGRRSMLTLLVCVVVTLVALALVLTALAGLASDDDRAELASAS